MSPRRTRAAITEQSAVSTRSKTQKINVNEDAELIQRTRQSQRREKSLDVKNNLEATAKQRNTRKKSPDVMVILKSVKKKSRWRLNLGQEAETEDKMQNLTMDTNESIKILRDRHNKVSMTEYTKHDFSESNTSKDLDLNKVLNKKLQRKSVALDVKKSPIIVTPKGTPPKLSLTPHRSKKTPKKSPISLGSPKTHSITVSRLLKSPRKLSLFTSKENLNKSDNKSHYEELEKNKDKLNNNSMSHKSLLLTSSITKNKRKKSDNLKTIGHKFSKSPKIVLRSPKSKKSKSHKLKVLSPAQKVKKNLLKTSTSNTSDTILDLDAAESKINVKKSPLSKEKIKNLTRIKRRLLKAETISQKKDVLAEPIVLLERLSPEKIQNVLTANKIQLDTYITTRSPLVNIGSNFKVFTASTESDMSVHRNSNVKLRNGNVKKLTNIVSPRIKHNTSIQQENRSSIPLMSSTPQQKNIPLIDMNTSNTSRYKNQSNISNVMHKSTDIEKSKSSLFDNDINNISQFHISNVTKRDATYDKDSLITPEKEQEKKRNTYELEQPQTLSLQRMIRKRTSTDANLSFKENFKRAKVHFADGKFDTSNADKSINKSIRSRLNISRNVNMQKNNSAQKSKKIETPKFNRNSLVSSFKARSSPRTNIVTPTVQLSRIQVTPKTFTLMEKKSEKKSSTKKVPNFGKIHEQMFAKSESLVDAKKRLEARHLTFTAKKFLPKIDAKKKEKRPLPTDTKDGTHNRFGFKLRKNEATHIILTKQTTFSKKKQQYETRMALKGVRTNRRFELQMKARNLTP